MNTSTINKLFSYASSKSGLNLAGRFLALIIVFLFFAIFVEDGKFYTLRNLENIVRQSSVYATAALGMTFVIITAGIDLSVGSTIALAVVVVAWTLNLQIEGTGGDMVYLVHQYPFLAPVLACILAIVASTLVGLFNGAVIVRLRMVPFIVTLGSMGIIRGLAKGIASERDIYPPEETWIGGLMDPTLTNQAKSWMIFPAGVWILIVCIAVASFLLKYTRFGRHVYAVGSNEETARLCGVPVGRTKIIVYGLTGFFCALAGFMQFSYIGGVGQPTTGVMYELFVIAAVIIGGASFSGGEGSVLGTIIGALIITILYMGGQQIGWPKWVQEMVIGGIIILAVAVDRIRHRKLA